MTYHPTTNPTALPPVTDLASLDALPWGGNAWWDLPIMEHALRAVKDESRTREDRKAIAARAGYLMTGEDCTFATEAEFDRYLSNLSYL